ncbi:hypothetical protein MKW92_041916 [Papaver armeniacum]|nr:hypothetical protein MKW92_041916 [Papaver armeniacum]
MSIYCKGRQLSLRFMVSLLSLIRNVFFVPKQWELASGLVDEMRQRAISLINLFYSTLITHFGKEGDFDSALSWLQQMEQDRYCCQKTFLIIQKRFAFFRLKRAGITPDLVAYNSMINVFVNSSKIKRFVEALSIFSEMKEVKCPLDLTTCNVMIDIVCFDMRKMAIEPSVVSYNTILRVYGEAELFAKDIEQNVVTYNTMIKIYGKSLEHEKGDCHFYFSGCRRTTLRVFRRFDAGEVKDISVFGCLIDLLSRNKKQTNVIEVFEKMRGAGYFPNSNVIALVLNAYGKLREFEKAEAMYKEMQDEGCVFPDEVHFQMLSLYGWAGDFTSVESLFQRLDSNPNIDKKELHLVTASVYERSNRLDDASQIISQINKRGISNTLPLTVINVKQGYIPEF